MLGLVSIVIGSLIVVDPPSLQLIEKARSQKFEVTVGLDDSGGAASEVSLWYTTDDARSWLLFETRTMGNGDADSVAGATEAAEKEPHAHMAESRSHSHVSFAFRADVQGLYGFYVVAVNPGGMSGEAPDSETVPHLWTYVDYAPPVLQLHGVTPGDLSREPREVDVVWSAVDYGLKARPITVSYRKKGGNGWHTIASSLSNSGRYVWRVEDGLDGEVMLRVTVQDRAGHVVEARSGWVDVSRVAPAPRRLDGRQDAADMLEGMRGRVGGARALLSGHPAGVAGFVDGRDATLRDERAWALYRKGLSHAARGENRLASSRLRDALSIDPTMSEALVALGGVLYALDDAEGSVESYQLALQYSPDSRDAMEGLASTYIGRREFDKAVRELSRIVRTNPNDAKAWLNLGDVAIYQGDEILARQHYEKSLTSRDAPASIVEQSRVRLADLKRLAREFRQTEDTWPNRPR